MVESSIKSRMDDSYVGGEMDMSGVELNADQMEAALQELDAEPDHIPMGNQARYNPLRARR